MLHLTSCLFATIVVHAHYRQAHSYHHAFLLLTVTSILFHTTRGSFIRRVDTLVAHAAYVLVSMDTRKVVSAADHTQWILLFPLAVALQWTGQRALSERAAVRMHALLHITTVVGMHVYLAALY